MAFEPQHSGRSLSLMPTYRCTAACAHCGTLSSPQDKTRLDQEHLMSAIDQAADLGYQLVVFTGGEATLAGDGLLALMRHAATRGLPTRLVTNAWWARDEIRAAEWISRFVGAGLTELNCSTGDEHVRFVPLDRVLLAAEAAVDAKLPMAIMVEVTRDRTVTKVSVESHQRFLKLRAATTLLRVIESPWMPLSPTHDISYDVGMTADRRSVAARSGCDSVLSTTTVQADGTIGACCGIGLRLIPELHVGDIRNGTLAEADEAAQQDFLKRWIRVEGPERILAWAASHDSAIDWEGRYAHHCQACLRLYSDPRVRAVIREHYREKVTDVLVGEWLLFRYAGSRVTLPSQVAATVRSADGAGISAFPPPGQDI